ncbi:helix-hairpin-helix domain-containing protein [Rhodanobacter sp. C01]|uniref:ComEA family DNA-binding protein n=1 Tax=Rhodanobacter sp. C01 TaxID=1945856 RepID=UPI000987CB29|nr:helix-hairpin-helix domain-containing protein [Rhodanobacter sp. C01]OOG50170.1 competence protein ComEA [Rhodanobacter sp. C01]
MFHKLAAFALALTLALPGLSFAATPVNINKADATTIASSLDGIGQSKAQAIVAWRDAHGPFKSADDLAQVKGIGQATLERNRAAILLTDATTPATTAAAKADKPAKSRRRSKKAAAEDAETTE